MYLPPEIVDIINDYFWSLIIFETRQRVNSEFKKINQIFMLQTLHNNCTYDGNFDPFFCLEVLNFIKTH